MADKINNTVTIKKEIEAPKIEKPEMKKVVTEPIAPDLKVEKKEEFNKEAWIKEVEAGTKWEVEESRKFIEDEKAKKSIEAKELRAEDDRKWLKEQAEKKQTEEIEKKQTQKERIEAYQLEQAEKNKSEQEQKLDEYNALLDSGASISQIKDFTKTLPREMLPNLRMASINHFKNTSNLEFVDKYSSYNNEQLFDAQSQGDFVIWDEQYALLNPEQKASYAEFYALKQKAGDVNINEQTNWVRLSIENNIKEIESYLNTSEMEKKVKEITGNDKITTAYSELNAIADEITDTKAELKKIEAQVRVRHKWVPDSILSWIIKDKQQVVWDALDKLINRHTNKLATISGLQNQMKTDLSILQMEFENDKYLYQNALAKYNADIAWATELEKMKLEEQNKINGEYRKFLYDKKIAEYQNALDKTKEKPTYEVDSNGRLVWIVDGVATPVIDNLGNTIYKVTKDGYKEYLTEDGNWNKIIVRTKPWETPIILPIWLDWKIEPIMNDLYSKLWTVQSKAFGTSMNEFMQTIGAEKIFTNNYTQNQKLINEAKPKVWDVVIWNDWVDKQWKLWVVLDINYGEEKLQVFGWDNSGKWQWQGEVVDMLSVNASNGWYHRPKSTDKAITGYDNSLVPYFSQASEWKKIDYKNLWVSSEEFKKQFNNYTQELSKWFEQEYIKIYELARYLRYWDGHFGATATWVPVFNWTDAQTYETKWKAFIWGQALEHLINLKSRGATFGALSDAELEMIKTSALALDAYWDEATYEDDLDKVITSLKKHIPSDYKDEKIKNTRVESNWDYFTLPFSAGYEAIFWDEEEQEEQERIDDALRIIGR